MCPGFQQIFDTPCIICLIFPRASQLAFIGKLEARARLSNFEYEIKESRETNDHFKEAAYRNQDMSQQP